MFGGMTDHVRPSDHDDETCCVLKCDKPGGVVAKSEDPAVKGGYRFHYCSEHWESKQDEFPDLERVDDAD